MATRIQFRRGTTAQHATFTGAVGEMTVDTDKEVVVVHDGSTAGGFDMARADMNNVSNPKFGGTGTLCLPDGTTAQRGTVSTGYIRYNSTTGQFEGYDGSQWRQMTHNTVVSSATTTSNRTLVNSETWQTHLSVSVTTDYKGPIMCVAQAAHGYESGAVNVIGRFTGPATSPEMQVFVQGFGSNRAQGIQSMQYTFENVNAGSYTVNWQVRNDGGSSTGIMNYDFVTGLYQDRFDVYYLS